MTIGTLVSRLRRLEERHGEEGPIALVSHRAIYQGDQIPEGVTIYPTEEEAIEAFNEGQSRPVIAIGIADFHKDAGPVLGWITESTTDPERASVVIHDDIRRSR
jgi:hypothetical protein